MMRYTLAEETVVLGLRVRRGQILSCSKQAMIVTQRCRPLQNGSLNNRSSWKRCPPWQARYSCAIAA